MTCYGIHDYWGYWTFNCAMHCWQTIWSHIILLLQHKHEWLQKMCPVYKVIAIWETPQISFETYDLNARSQETLETTLDFIPHFPLFFGYTNPYWGNCICKTSLQACLSLNWLPCNSTGGLVLIGQKVQETENKRSNTRWQLYNSIPYIGKFCQQN